MKNNSNPSSRHRIGMQLFIALTAITILLYILSTSIAVYRQQREIKESLIQEGLSDAAICAGSLRTAVFAENREMIRTILLGIIAHKGVVSVAVFNDSGNPLFLWSRNPGQAGGGSAKFAGVPYMTEMDNAIEFNQVIEMETVGNSEEDLYAEKSRKIKKAIGYVSIVMDKVKLNIAMKKVILLNTSLFGLFVVSIAFSIYFTVRKIAGPFEHRMAEMKKMEAVGTLARGIAHDFNNILGAAKGYLYVLKKKLEGSDLSELVAYTEGSLDRAKKLVESLLSFSNTDSNKFALLDINEVVKSLSQNFEPFVAVRYSYTELLHEGPLVINGDRLQLEQVVMNLINNAVDAMGETGALSVETAKVTIDGKNAGTFGLRSGGRFACVTVQDTGEGVDSALKSKIFEPFFTTKEVGKGTGLGLAIVYEIVKEHKGFVKVDSIRGSGASFKVYLPCYTEDIK